jgi:hypothetical protein
MRRRGWKLVGPTRVAVMFALAWCVSSFVAAQCLALPVGRVYEMVSPVYKGGYGARALVAVAQDGEHVAFGSLGAFAGEPASNPLSNFYIADREEDIGWRTVPVMPPASIAGSGGVADFSPTLASTLDEVRLGPNYGSASAGTEDEFLLHQSDLPDTAPLAPEPGPNFEVIGMVLKGLNEKHVRTSYEGASSDFSHVVFQAPEGKSEQFLPEAIKSESPQYDLASSLPCGALSSAVCRDAPEGGGSLRLVELNNKDTVINPSCPAQIGSGEGGFNAVSADGAEVFFTTEVDGICAVPQLFVRMGGQRTLEISRPLEAGRFGGCVKEKTQGEVPCAGADERESVQFQGASEDGSKVFFTSAQSLAPGDSDVSTNLYMVSIGCQESEPGCNPAGREVTGLVQVSSDPNAGEPAEVQGVVAITPDGSRVYFVAEGDLLSPAARGVLASEGRALPQAGAANLYVYDSVTGSTGFVAELCSGPGHSGGVISGGVLLGGVEDIRCPSSIGSETGSNNVRNDTPLWHKGKEAQVNVCGQASASECTGERETGRFLVFASYSQLSADDTDAGRDVYRYDALTGALERVSGGENGSEANGNGQDSHGGAFDAALAPSETLNGRNVYAQRNMGGRAVSEDGSRIVFTTAGPLSAAAINGLSNAYEWNDGRVSLVSTGTATIPVELTIVSSSGVDIFFTTTQGILPQDTDGQEDVYDARLGGGFPPAPAEAEVCSGDACQGPLTNPAPLLIPGSVSQAPGENFPPPAKATPKKKRTKKLAVKKKRKAGHARRASARSRTASGRRPR